MNIAQLKNRFANAKKKIATTATLASTGIVATSANAAVDVSELVEEIKESKTPIASVAGASLGAYVAIRVWKLVRKAI